MLYSYVNRTSLLDRRHAVNTAYDDNSIWLDEGSRVVIAQIGTKKDKYKCSKVWEITYNDLYTVLVNTDNIQNE
jgi:hypothetical protein